MRDVVDAEEQDAKAVLGEVETRLDATNDRVRSIQSRVWASIGLTVGVGGVAIGVALTTSSTVVATAAAGVFMLASVVLLSYAAVQLGVVTESLRYLRVLVRDKARDLNGIPSRSAARSAPQTGGRTQAEIDLEERVRQAISDSGSVPDDFDLVVEGRTVYLRGAVADPASVDAAAERIHGVPGVVAVVNLTTSASWSRREGGDQSSGGT